MTESIELVNDSLMEQQVEQPAQPALQQQSRSYMKKFKKYQKDMMKSIKQRSNNMAESLQKEKAQIARTEQMLGADTSKMLKEVCMVAVPAETNETGEVVKPASSYLDVPKFLKEARFIQVVKREDRIRSGKRKRSSGRSSSRRSHNSTLSFILKRNNLLENIKADVTAEESVST